MIYPLLPTLVREHQTTGLLEYDTALSEKWGPAQWAASVERRKRMAAMRAERVSSMRQRGLNPEPQQPYLDEDLFNTSGRTLNGRVVRVWKSTDTPRSSKVLFQPGAGPRAAAADITVGTRGRKADALSALRHERGHVTADGAEARQAASLVHGQRFGQKYTRELLAWRDAVKHAPFNRVRWPMVQTALTNYLSGDEHHVKRAEQRGADPYELAGQTAAAHVALLKRYARANRRTELKRVEMPW